MKRLYFTLIASLICGFGFAQTTPGFVESDSPQQKFGLESVIIATNMEFFEFNSLRLLEMLHNNQEVKLKVPVGSGQNIMFKLKRNNLMPLMLQVNFSDIISLDGTGIYKGQSVSGKFDVSHKGFHGMVFLPDGKTIFIDPVVKGNIQTYGVYSRAGFETEKEFVCNQNSHLEVEQTNESAKAFGSCELRTYEIAIAATGEYTAFHGGTVADAMAAQVTTMNRVSGLYERDISVTFTFIVNNDDIIYTNASTDPYTNGDAGAMLSENISNLSNVIGNSNFDIGHVFGTNSGGVASLGSVCRSNKAGGVTGGPAPIGDPFDIDYVAHEVGHQFRARHTFNNSCSGNRSDQTAVEPGSGSTIMAYAGICPPNVQSNSDAYFHGISLEEIGNFITGGTHTCPVKTPLVNNAPVVDSVRDGFSIPANTPFILTAYATDVDGDALTYCWEQMNNDISTQPPVASATDGPSFRSFDPVTNNQRFLPRLSTLAAGSSSTYEVLSSISRSYDFRVMVRDNASGGGCNDHEDVSVSVVGTAGPFIVNYPSSTGIQWEGLQTYTVTWDVANTDQAPINCSNVHILLSSDGGVTYTDTLATTSNDGSHTVVAPNIASTTCRIMVVSEAGTFFDISDNNFEISLATLDFTMDIPVTETEVCQPNDATYSIEIGEVGGFSGNVTFGTQGLPAGLTAVFSPDPAVPTATVTMTISGTGGVTAGTYDFDVEATGNSNTKSMEVTLNIADNTLGGVTQLNPADAATGVNTAAMLNWSPASGAGVTYTVEIASDAGMSTIVETASAISDTTYTATLLANETTYYWRVRAQNACVTGAFSPIRSFTTNSCFNFVASDVPRAISTINAATTNSTMVINQSGLINSVRVLNLTGTHTWISDLSFVLISPAGTEVTLLSNICNDEDDFNINFSDFASNSTPPCPPTDGGFYVPEEALSAFSGENPSGVWIMRVIDNSSGDGGELSSWTLDICVDNQSCTASETPVLNGPASACSGESVTFTVSGNLNDAADWEWYSGTCGGTSLGSGASLTFTANNSTTIFVRGEGGCVVPSACDFQSFPVTSVNDDVSVSGDGITLTADQNGATYQWIDCGTSIDILGETNQSFTATANGSYQVEVTRNSCVVSSSCVSVGTVGLEENSTVISIYPNPSTTGLYNFTTSTNVYDSYEVFDSKGKKVSEGVTSEGLIDLSQMSTGIYTVIFIGNQDYVNLKLVKE